MIKALWTNALGEDFTSDVLSQFYAAGDTADELLPYAVVWDWRAGVPRVLIVETEPERSEETGDWQICCSPA